MKTLDLSFLNFDAAPAQKNSLLELGGELWMPSGCVGMLISTPAAGKTMAVLQLAISVATGRKWLGAFDVIKRGKVLLVTGQDDPKYLCKRLRRIAKSMVLDDREIDLVGKNVSILPLLAGAEKDLLDDSHNPTVVATQIQEFVRGSDFDLIVLDPGCRFMGKHAEKDNYAATRFVQVLTSLALSHNKPTVLFTHSAHKYAKGLQALTDKDVARGSSAFSDSVRWQANMVSSSVNDLELAGLSCTKSNDGIKGEVVWLRRGKHGVLELETRKTITSKAVKGIK
jgi:regulatory protein RepA